MYESKFDGLYLAVRGLLRSKLSSLKTRHQAAHLLQEIVKEAKAETVLELSSVKENDLKPDNLEKKRSQDKAA